ncbi:MAG: HutD family protein [Proteobacteria bacterium]|nr:HutD family protein [Pseudomonadota bacterium]
MRWKNGQGETAGIAVSPAEAPLETFDWRVSMARVEAGGPFSAFDGVDRTLTVLDGEGVRLSVGRAATVELTPESDPFRFRGDDPASAELVAGPITDLNVMTRRGRCTHHVWVACPGEAVAAVAGTILLFCRAAPITVRSGGHFATLGPRDTLVFENGADEIEWQGAAAARLLVVRIDVAG